MNEKIGVGGDEGGPLAQGAPNKATDATLDSSSGLRATAPPLFLVLPPRQLVPPMWEWAQRPVLRCPVVSARSPAL